MLSIRVLEFTLSPVFIPAEAGSDHWFIQAFYRISVYVDRSTLALDVAQMLCRSDLVVLSSDYIAPSVICETRMAIVLHNMYSWNSIVL